MPEADALKTEAVQDLAVDPACGMRLAVCPRAVLQETTSGEEVQPLRCTFHKSLTMLCDTPCIAFASLAVCWCAKI